MNPTSKKSLLLHILHRKSTFQLLDFARFKSSKFCRFTVSVHASIFLLRLINSGRRGFFCPDTVPLIYNFNINSD